MVLFNFISFISGRIHTSKGLLVAASFLLLQGVAVSQTQPQSSADSNKAMIRREKLHKAFKRVRQNQLTRQLGNLEKKEQELFKAVMIADTGDVALLIKRHANVNAKTSFGQTAISYAISGNEIRCNYKSPDYNQRIAANVATIIRMLVDAGEDVNEKDGGGLKDACLWMNKDAVAALIHAGADPNMKSKDGESALMTAASAGCYECVTQLLDAGAKANAKDKEGKTPLLIACITGSEEENWNASLDSESLKIVEVLLNAGAHVNDRSKAMKGKGKTLLEQTEEVLEIEKRHDAFESIPYRIDIIDILKKHGAKGKSIKHVEYDAHARALFAAIGRDDTNAVKSLIADGVNVNEHDTDAPTALWYACTKQNANLVKTLINAGADVNARFGYDGPALIWEMDATGEYNVTDTAVVAALLAGGADVNLKNDGRETALARAFVNPHGFDNSDAIMLLINAGADVNLKDNEGYTSLWWWHENVKVYEALLKHGADVNAKSKDGRTPLMNAANAAIAMMLIHAGADVNAISIYGDTPLMEAAKQGHDSVVAVLLEAGAHVNVRQKVQKLTALGYAMDEKKYFDGEYKKKGDESSSKDVARYQKIIDLLKQHGAKE